ncbi:PilZ domain-containing protein [Blastochloris sulfoviridis]|uniref:PilZ domain-containing protein n=1 Tax=Blastochloris sulfoviridis TaxID=50712 RepID=A0A5M6I187_9HYPH|nr:PilZ domain-containing protein [Blastochloris sulfoviridis]KAA5601922.1 PilZ domain-containing protein [Blastochloris sulfoviridis]
MIEERRRTKRRRTFYRGTILHTGRSVSLDCTVRDVSVGGARLEVQTDAALPETFALAVPQLDFASRPVRIVWTRNRDIGVHFEAAEPEGPAAASLAERVARLEHDLAKLTRQFGELRMDIKRYRNEE